MASQFGVVKYWNGNCGWIKPIGVSDLPTAYATELLMLSAHMQSGSGTVIRNGTASNSLLASNDPGLLGGTCTFTASTLPYVAQGLIITLS
jgi:hypothetical protein